MATIKIVLRTDKIRKNGESPIYIRMTANRKSKYISVQVTLAEKYWNADKERVKKSHHNAARINALLAKKRAEVEALALDIARGEKRVDGHGLRDAMSEGGTESFYGYATSFLERLEREGRYGTLKNYSNAINCLKHWMDKSHGWADLSFSKFNRQLAGQYKAYLENERGNSSSTVNNKFAAFKSIFSHARSAGVIPYSLNPFAGIKIKVRRPKKQIPSREELAQLAIPHKFDTIFQRDVRNLYMFCANMAGMRFGDAVTLRWSQVTGDRLRWETRKTKKQRLIYMPQAVMDIVDFYREDTNGPLDFVFPFLRGMEEVPAPVLHRKVVLTNTACNRSLEALCKRAGFAQKYSFHTSRHFFATDSLRRGMRVEILQHLLTHSSLNQTMEYAQIANEDMDAAMMAYEKAKLA